jgi:hypothetical protein
MLGPVIRKFTLVSIMICSSFLAMAQTGPSAVYAKDKVEEKNKPLKILNVGKQVTVKSTMNIRTLMVWTSGGHRIVEERKLNTSSYSFRVQVNDKLFFLMVQLADGRTYSEKIGVQ